MEKGGGLGRVVGTALVPASLSQTKLNVLCLFP